MTSYKPRLMARLKATAHITASRPHVIIVPLALMALMMGLGVWAVIAGAEHQATSYRVKASSHVEAAASAMQLSIERAVLPAVQLADWIQHTLDYGTLQKQWLDRVPDWWKKAPKASMALTMAPYGNVSSGYPLTQQNQALVGFDKLGSRFLRHTVIEAIQNGDVTVAEPGLGDDEIKMSFQIPVFGRNVSKGETWGIPFNATDCPEALCYNATTRTKWWGIAAVVVNVSAFITDEGPIGHLTHAGYHVQIWRPPNLYANETQRMSLDPKGARPQPSDAVRGVVPIANVEWEVYVWVDNWEPDWKAPLIATVVVASIICGCLIFAVLLSWEEHRLLLRSILPESTINRMRTDMEWKQTFQGLDNLRLVEIETPAQHMQSIIHAILSGEPPPMALVVAVQQALQRSDDVYRPAAQDLQSKINAGNLDSDVQRHLGTTLAVKEESDLDLFDTQNLDDDPGLTNLARDFMAARDKDAVAEPCSPAGSHVIVPIIRRNANGKGSDFSATSSAKRVSFGQRFLKGKSIELSAGAAAGAKRMSFGQRIMSRISNDFSTTLGGTRMSFGQRNLNANDFTGARRRSIATTCMTVSPELRATLADLVESPRTSTQGATIDDNPARAAIIDGKDDEDHEMIPVAGSEAGAYPAMVDALLESQVTVSPRKPIMEQLDRVLANADSWVFDAFELEEVTQGHSLSVLGYYLIHNSGCMEYARMDGAVLARFLQRVESGYKRNPYHNSCHAADVLHTFHVILHQGGLMPGYCDQLTLLGCYLAAIVHDYEHGGYSNDFLVSTNDELAVRYNDRSPMENHHLAAAWGLLNQPGLNCLSGLTKASWDKLRKLVIDLVLATDMKQHFAIVGQFSTLHNTCGGSSSLMMNTMKSMSSLETTSVEVLVPSGEHDKLLSLQVALKCADVGNLAAPLPVYLRWVAVLEEEFFLQGDAERARGMAISPLCDRTKEGVTKSQIGFFDFVVLPLFNNFTQKFRASRPLLNAVVGNYRYWQVKSAHTSGERDLTRRWPGHLRR